jgi:putative endonuclease
MNDLYHVYILRSESALDTFYTGFTENMTRRLADHNAGRDPHTAKFRPWGIKTVVSFADRQQALEFERYLKTASGRAFSQKRL